jgi:hypothetical protein
MRALPLLTLLLLAGCGAAVQPVIHPPELIPVAAGTPFTSQRSFSAPDAAWLADSGPLAVETALALLAEHAAAVPRWDWTQLHPAGVDTAVAFPAGWAAQAHCGELLVSPDGSRVLAELVLPPAVTLPAGTRAWLETDLNRRRALYLYLLAP